MADTASWSAVAAAWGGSADYVEGMNQPVTVALLAGAAPAPGKVVLEIGAGAGELARQLAERVAPGGRVIATDAAAGMVEVMRKRLAGMTGVEVRACDAASTGLSDGLVDAVLARMSLMFSGDPGAAVAEAHRVLSPGGRYAAATWAGPMENMWMASVGMAAAMNGAIPPADPSAPGGPFSLSEPKQLSALLKDARFVDVDVQDVPLEVMFPDADAHFENVSSLAGPLAVALSAASDDVRAAVRRTTAEVVARFAGPHGLVFPGLARVVTGTRPE